MRVAVDLLKLAQGGDSAALAQLLAQLQPDIRRYARRQCHRASALEDVVQEALIVLWRRIGDVRSPAALAGWIWTVIGRLCMLPALMLLRGAGEPADARAIARMPTDDLRLDLVRGLESLPPALREVVLLRDFEECTIGEMAHRLALTPAATKSRLHRARVLLREYLLGTSAQAKP